MYNILVKFSKPFNTIALSWLEHMTVNHGVPGSSPGWGASEKAAYAAFFISPLSLTTPSASHPPLLSLRAGREKFSPLTRAPREKGGEAQIDLYLFSDASIDSKQHETNSNDSRKTRNQAMLCVWIGLIWGL